MEKTKTIKYKTEDQVKKALKIDDFSLMPQERIKEFTGLIPHMDKNLAESIISQFPDFTHYSRSIISECRQLCDSALDYDKVGAEGTIKGYQTILDSLSKRMEVPDITEDEVRSITNDMIEVADKIAEEHKQNQGFVKDVVGQALKIIGVAVSFVLVSVLVTSNDTDNQNEQNGQENSKDDSAGGSEA